jgi:AcrR family transcriptional regulator
MSRAGRPRIHVHLSRESIAQAGLALVDRAGLDALTLRNLARELSVGTTTLYGHVRTRDEIVADVVGLLLGEVDTSARPGERWDEVLRRVAHSLRAVAHRHPAAFTLVSVAAVDEAPVLDYARAIAEASIAGGMSEQQFIESWQVVDAFLTGFLLMEATALTRAREAGGDDASASADAFRGGMAKVHSDEAFAAALGVIISGLRQSLE